MGVLVLVQWQRKMKAQKVHHHRHQPLPNVLHPQDLLIYRPFNLVNLPGKAELKNDVYESIQYIYIKQSIAISIEWNIILTIKRKGSGGSGSPKTHFNRQNSKDSIDGKNGDGYSRQHSENHIDTKNDEIDSERIKQEDVVVEVKSTNGKSGEEASKSKQGASLVTKEEPTNGTFANGTAKSNLGTDCGTIKKPPPNQV